MKPIELVNKQVERRLSAWAALDRTPPRLGWIRTIRQALGMSGSQLGSRIGVTKQAVADFEADERRGSISLAALRKVAAGMDCDLVYALVPRDSLARTLEDAARTIAKAELDRVQHTMSLEAQGTNPEALDRLLHERIRDLLRDTRRLWRAAGKGSSS